MTAIIPSAEQQAILDHGLASLRVEAGAGTGKTTTLAYRVLALMDTHGIAASQILGVTFTNKAAHELAQRIGEARKSLIDPGGQVDVLTYHGFAAQLLATHGALIGVERDTKVISPTFSRQILVDSIREVPFDIQDITHRPTITNSLLKLANDLADNLCTPEELLELPADSEVDVRRHELARALTNYNQAKRRLDVTDYGDLIRLSVKLIRRHTHVADQLRAQYRCVLLDEYQDTNPAQRELFQLLFGNGTAVTAVGDPDQTIYEWRGATPDNFASFPEHFRSPDGSPSPTLPLSVNRRSGQPILDLANRLRREIKTTKPGLDLSADDPDKYGNVHVAWYDNARAEAEEIARLAHELHSDGVEWSDMAVLFRKNKDISIVRDALDEHQVPLQVANLGGLLGIPEIVEIRAWLRILADPEDSPALARVLFGSGYRLGMSDLAPFARWAARRSNRGEAEILDHTLIEALDHLETIETTDQARVRLSAFRDTHRLLLTKAQGSSLIELTREILAVTGAWQEMDAMPYPSGLSARLNVHRFLDLAEDWSPLDGRPSLEAFLMYLDLMAEDPVEELDTARVGTGNAVTLMTIHRAKGLEWDVVFVPALYHGNFPSFARVLDPSLRSQTIPASLRLDPQARSRLAVDRDEKERAAWLRGRHDDQEWRLAYVGATRAKSHLYLSGAQWYGGPEPNRRISKPSRLLEIARESEAVAIGAWTEAPTERLESLGFPPGQAGPDPAFGATWDAALRAAMDDPEWAGDRAVELDVRDLYDASVNEFQETLFSLPNPAAADVVAQDTRVSVTGLVTYADCPKRYYWSEVDRLPRRSSAAARRGTELHRRIELHSRGIMAFEELSDDLYDRVPGESEGDVGGTRGWEAYENSRYATVTPRFIELPFELQLTGRDNSTAWLRGRVDAVYPDGDSGWEIVDFKSGRRSTRPSSIVQLQAYAVAATEAGFGAPAPEQLSVSFVYLGDGLDVASSNVDGPWLNEANRRLSELVDGIQHESFDPTPSSACHRCDFLRFCEPGKAFVADSE